MAVDSVRRTCDPYLRGTVRYELSKLKAGDERQLLLPQEWQRFYQFYGNMAVAVLVAGVVWLLIMFILTVSDFFTRNWLKYP